MHEAVARMLARYACGTLDEHLRAIREIVQEIALLGLWRGRLFDVAAFYGGTALRIVHGSGRFSEDLDFTLLNPSRDFDTAPYLAAAKAELGVFGFDMQVEVAGKSVETAIQSAFLKAEARRQLLVISADESLAHSVPASRLIKVKVELDTDPPGGFDTEVRHVLRPIPFSMRVCCPPDLFAGKMHAVLFRRWKNRVKGRDWYDLLWFAAHQPRLRLAHLESRMRQTGHLTGDAPLTPARFRELLHEAIERLDVARAVSEVRPFVPDPRALDAWSRPLFHDAAGHIELV